MSLRVDGNRHVHQLRRTGSRTGVNTMEAERSDTETRRVATSTTFLHIKKRVSFYGAAAPYLVTHLLRRVYTEERQTRVKTRARAHTHRVTELLTEVVDSSGGIRFTGNHRIHYTHCVPRCYTTFLLGGAADSVDTQERAQSFISDFIHKYQSKKKSDKKNLYCEI